jgi:hypothetical protein
MKATGRSPRPISVLVALSALGLLVAQALGACSSDSPIGPGGSTTSSSGTGGTGAGGTGAGNDGAGGMINAQLSHIVVTPADNILEVDLNKPGSQAFVAIAHYTDASTLDVSSEAVWSSTAVGTFNGATLEIPASATTGAITTIVSAEWEGATGQAQLTVVTYRMTGPNTDFFFILPFEDPAGEQQKPLDFSTDVKSLDVLFDMDTTGSMDGEIVNLQVALTYLVIPKIKDLVKDSWFGAAAFMDFPVDGHGALHGYDCGNGGRPEPDQPFELFQEITNQTALVQAGVDAYSDAQGFAIGCGGASDRPESLIESLYQAATGEGLNTPDPTLVLPNHNGVGGVNFREGSMPVIVPISDAPSHAPGETTICDRPPPLPDFGMDYKDKAKAVAHTRQQAKDAIANICGKVVGVASIDESLKWPDNCFAIVDMEDFATFTDARVPPEAWDVPQRPAGCPSGQCCTGLNGIGRPVDAQGLCPLVFKVDENGSGMSDSIATGMQMLTRYSQFDVVTEKVGETEGMNGEPLPADKTTADFIVSVTPDHYTKPAPPPTLPDPIMTATGFEGVTPGTVVSFNVTAFNDFVGATTAAQFFKAKIRVLAGGCTELDDREVFILVPPAPLQPPE